MEPLRPIFWGQGMFLQPQHFQQQDWYNQARVRHLLHLFSPFCWGVKSLKVNESALQNFLFEVEHCEVVTWDGTVLRFLEEVRSNNAKLQPRSFEADLDPSGKPLSVYLGIKKLQLEDRNIREGASNGTDTAEDSGHARFTIEEAEVPDLYAGGEQISPMQYLVHETHLLFDAPLSRSQDYELVKIAEVQRASDGDGAVLSSQFIPPCITTHSSSVLEGMIKEIRELLTAKGRELSEYQSQQNDRMVELGAKELGYLVMNQTINRYIPLFHHYLEMSEQIHPNHIYALLRQLVGELSTFSNTTSALGALEIEDVLPPYQHDNLWPCFDLATKRAKELLTAMTAAPVGDILLQYDGEEYFTADLNPDIFAGDNRYYLAIKSDLSPSVLHDKLQNTGKVASLRTMPQLREYYLLGLALEPLETCPEELIRRAHYRYFFIDTNQSENWTDIETNQNIAISVYDEDLVPQETEIRLLVVYS